MKKFPKTGRPINLRDPVQGRAPIRTGKDESAVRLIVGISLTALSLLIGTVVSWHLIGNMVAKAPGQSVASIVGPAEPATDGEVSAGTSNVVQTAGAGRGQDVADAFMAFYLINTRSRVDFCRGLGVDISPFSAEFRRVNSEAYSRALSSLGGATFSEDGLYQKRRGEMATLIAKDMTDMGAKLGQTPKVACKTMADRADILAGLLTFKTIQPDKYRELMAG